MSDDGRLVVDEFASTVTQVTVAAFVVSVLALATSGLAYWRQVKWAKVAASAEQRLVVIEEARHAREVDEVGSAALDLQVEPVGRETHVVVVSNRGLHTARNVTLELAPRAPGRAPGLLNSPFPATIAPGAETSAHLDENATTTTLLAATMRWTDGGGEQTKHVDVTIR